jgi:2-polyprenyl-3-methyl-5-hydroxy-6-metoxy-1,4-benzoquinol methylase
MLDEERGAFDRRTRERIEHGFVPDLRRLAHVDWFYNNVWRDPRLVEIHWMPRIRRILDRARERGGQVLEIGCGYGMISLELARNGLHVVGVDLSEASIEIAEKYRDENPHREGFGSLEYRSGDIMDLRFAEGAFDTVVFFRSLHHLPGAEKLMERLHRWVKPNGRLLASEPIRAHVDRDTASFAALLRTLLPTWQEAEVRLGGAWSEKRWEARVDQIYREYAFEDHHQQSPLDNSLSHADVLCRVIERGFEIREKSFSDAFLDKMIGGLRGEDRYELARFLKFLDDYLLAKEILPPTSIELCAVRRAEYR